LQQVSFKILPAPFFMQLAKRLFFVLCLLAPAAQAQTTYLPLGHDDYPIFDRLETLSGRLSTDIFTTVKPLPRKGAVDFLLKQRAHAIQNNLSGVDRFNIDHAISVSGEWDTTEGGGAIRSRRPWFKTFYKTQADFFRVQEKDFFLSINPVLGAQLSYENDNPDNPLFYNSRGLEARGLIANRVGFYTYVTDNQERMPSFVNNWIAAHDAVPGADYYQTPQPGKYDYLLARGYVDFAAVKDHINLTLGYDKHFLGDGIRSLFLSDFASSGATFFRINTKVWKLNYQNLYMELTPQYTRGGDRRLPHKYATMHHLSINATRWLNVGLFEVVIFDRADRYEFSYMVPVIFYRQIERALGSPDNAVVGFNFKAIAARRLQLYGQLLLDEFKFSELTGGNGWWGNKFGVQLGAKYFNAFGVRNLDLQAEANIVRPFTYSHNDTLANYTHYNQPLAHPLGAGFAEVIGNIRYQPLNRLHLNLRGMYYRQGSDTAGSNFGSNIFLANNSRSEEFGVSLINGPQKSVALLNLNAGYEIRESLFGEIGFTYRRERSDNPYFLSANTTYFYAGLRLNMARRNYDFY